MKFAILPLVLLFATSAHATNIGMMMLRNAAILHDDQRIKSLIHKSASRAAA